MLQGCVSWPSALAREYERAGYWTGERLGDILRRPAVETPHRTAVTTRSERFTYAELDRRADRLASGLRALGLAPLDRVVIALANDVDFVTSSIALFRLGAIPVYALPSHRQRELHELCRATQARAIIIVDRQRGTDLRPIARAVAATCPSLVHVLVSGEPGDLTSLAAVDAEPAEHAPPDPREVAFLFPSGGTTGRPKLIPRTHDDYACQLRHTAMAVGADAETTYLAVLPVAHNAALGCPGVLGTLRLGGHVVLAADPSPDEVFPLVAGERPGLTTVMPAFLRLWSETAELFDADFGGIVVEVGGAPLDPELARRARARLGCTLSHWFGMAEGAFCCTRPEDPPALSETTQGRPLCAGDEFRITDDAGREVADGLEGELHVRGPMTLRGYYDAAEENRAAFTADGFLRTGDLVRRTPTGELVVTGRIKDIVNRAGEKVSAAEVEHLVATHPDVSDVALVALPDPLIGERACAFVVAGGGAVTLPEIRRHLSSRGLADFKLPDELVHVRALPRTALGKVDKPGLRAAWERTRADAEQLHPPA